MAKIKILNNTQNTFFLSGYAFPPGTVETQELTKVEETKIKKLLDRPAMKERIEKKLIVVNPKDEKIVELKTEETGSN